MPRCHMEHAAAAAVVAAVVVQWYAGERVERDVMSSVEKTMYRCQHNHSPPPPSFHLFPCKIANDVLLRTIQFK